MLLNPALALHLYTEEYPPLSFSVHQEVTGLGPEVVRAILQRLKQQADIQVLPWARAYHSNLNNADSAAFVTMRTPEREALFKWVGPITLSTDSFYALKDSQLAIHSDEDLYQVSKIALPRDWYSYQELQAKDMPNLLGVTSARQMFELLKHQRVPLILTDNLSFYTHEQSSEPGSPLHRSEVKLLYPYRQTYGYISFWKGTPDQEIQRWQEALDQMKRDGSFSRIYQSWLPGEPEPGLREPGTP
ncbi:substrate-binding periplasmic protein [Pseudomonas sp. 5P_3.1_Bac2]|uniref:substrate-binding periplasmic protein n=1 Tax=Pseudomonas sp. 5P_3.1_Bac2 TaxID=2971617 RepID=UPI0021C8F125|nr:transporter substrate-binding domain-containing protein [Pseudomonas sp. 5P_3.1_Bac2]MCU1715935.1 transporter substrate-binding domain-containing protein [Pseudomonas sp. 5P_3.1_Bac2]